MRKPRILIIGKAVMTFTSLTERVPDAGETLVSEGDFFFSPGGKGANAALCAARLGADAVLLARIGGDAYGKELTGIFEKESVDTRFLFSDSEKKTALAQIFREPDGNNRTTFFPGASVGLSVDNAEEAFTCYPDALYLSNSVDPEIVYYAVGKAHEQKIPVFFDLSPVCKTLDPSSVGVCEILTASEDAAAFYTGVAPTSAENALRAAIKLSALIHSKYVVLRLGKRGCFVYDGLHQELIPALDVRASDTNGAGDAFTASLAVRYMQNGGNISDAARFAACVGAYSVLKSGAASFPTVKELEEFINRYNNR